MECRRLISEIATFILNLQHVMGRAAIFVALFSFMYASMFTGQTIAQTGKLKKELLILHTENGKHKIEVEIADTPESKTRGLMFRSSLGTHQGMLFIYQKDEEILMWMKNTYIPLDMVFIKRDGQVHRIEHNTEPLSEEIISSGGAVSAVLELKAGGAKKFGLKAGDKILHPLFNTSSK